MTSEKISKSELLKGIKKMNSFGSRITGSEGQLKFIAYLQKEIEKLGLTIYRDPFFFKKWEAKEASLQLYGVNGPEDIEIASVFPYSGETKSNGITAELHYVEDKIGGYQGVKDKIAIIEINEADSWTGDTTFDVRSKYPKNIADPEDLEGPLSTEFEKFQYARLAKLRGARAVIFVWKGLSELCVRGQYLPYFLDYQGIPAVWVDANRGRRLVEAAQARRTATIKLVADTTPNAYTESFYCMLPGENTKESVIITTHTDGVNCVEENGSIALLQLIKALKNKEELKRTHIFVFATGHFRLPNFKSFEGGGIQATSKWLGMHKDLWNGKKGHLKAVAGVSVEHLGCLEWKDSDGEYKPTGKIQTELVYVGNEELEELFVDAAKERDIARVVTLGGHNFFLFGEGEPLFTVGIPEISLVSAPEYLCVQSENNEMDKFDIDLMYEQTKTVIKVLEELDSMSSEKIGPCEEQSVLVAKSEQKIKSITNKVWSAIKK